VGVWLAELPADGVPVPVPVLEGVPERVGVHEEVFVFEFV